MTPAPTAPLPDARREGTRPASPVDDPPPTVRYPVLHPPLTSLADTATPPPVSHRKLSRSFLGAADQDAQSADFPLPGETFLGFHLTEELGRGAFARVFLARQEALANRPVALKVTLRPTREAERIARLQHTNVVPVYSVHEAHPAQVICMPFLGRRTIAHLLRAYHAERPSGSIGNRRTSGFRVNRTTAVDSHAHPKCDPSTAPARTAAADPGEAVSLVRDPHAVLKVIGQLAAGLAHAHSRGVLHLDLKPANVLLPDIGEPMLLDFNLSFDVTAPERDLVGGTIPYMAIEQLLDLKSRGRGTIDVRTDLYSLGVMAFEMLTGTVPFPSSMLGLAEIDSLIAARKLGPPSLRELNPDVTPAVEAIVRKLLSADPAGRYLSAEDLRTDVERHLNDLPLKFARETSARERFGKWRRRNPRVQGRIAGVGLLGLALGLGGVAYQRAEANARSEAVERVRGVRTGLDGTRVDLVIPNDPASRGRGIERATEILAKYGLPDDADWQQRPEVLRLPESERAALASELGELMLLLAQAKTEAAAGKPAADRREVAAAALALNRAARGCFSPDAAPGLLDRQEAELAALAGEPAPEARPASDGPRNARDLFLDATADIARGRFLAAQELLKKVVFARPGDAAAQFCLAYCRQQRGDHDKAQERYDVAAALLPRDPRVAHNRGLIFGVKRLPADAEKEFTRAIEVAPDWPEAYRLRALARLRQGGEEKLKQAERDLAAALEKGGDEFPIRLLRAMVFDRLGDAAAARLERAAIAGREPSGENDFLVRGYTRVESDPKGALADFQAAEQRNPRSLVALQNQAHVLAEKLDRQDDALAAVTKAAEFYPEFAPARAGRAVVLARLGKRDDAHREAAAALVLSGDSEVLYQVACVYALTSKTNPADTRRALNGLRDAIDAGFRDSRRLAADHDLDSLRDNQEFRDLQRAIGNLFVRK